MPVITREDGQQFVLQTYREVLVLKSMSLMRRELRILEKLHGSNVRLFRQGLDQVEVVLSPDPGYLLGETLWHHFDAPRNFIYCEYIEAKEQALLVVARDGVLYEDALLPLELLIDELISLQTGEHEFAIYIAGDELPIGEYGEEDKFAFEPSLVSSFNRLSSSILEELPLQEAYHLVSSSEALSAIRESKAPRPAFIAVMAVLVILAAYGGYHFFKPKPVVKPKIKIVKVDPYEQYEKALATPSVPLQLLKMKQVIDLVNGIPGWRALEFTYNAGQSVLNIPIGSMGGSTDLIRTWGRMYNIPVIINTNGLQLAVPFIVPNRAPVTHIRHLQDTLSQLIDVLQGLLPESGRLTGSAIALSDEKTHGVYKEVTVTLKLNRISTAMLTMLAQTLQNYPITLQKMNFTNQQGLLNGTLVFSLLGD